MQHKRITSLLHTDVSQIPQIHLCIDTSYHIATLASKRASRHVQCNLSRREAHCAGAVGSITAAAPAHFNWFKRGLTNVTDDMCEGHPSTATAKDNNSAVRLTIDSQKSDLPADLDKLRHGLWGPFSEKCNKKRKPKIPILHHLSKLQHYTDAHRCAMRGRRFAASINAFGYRSSGGRDPDPPARVSRRRLIRDTGRRLPDEDRRTLYQNAAVDRTSVTGVAVLTLSPEMKTFPCRMHDARDGLSNSVRRPCPPPRAKVLSGRWPSAPAPRNPDGTTTKKVVCENVYGGNRPIDVSLGHPPALSISKWARPDRMYIRAMSACSTPNYLCSGLCCTSRVEGAGAARDSLHTLLTMCAELCKPAPVDVGADRVVAISAIRSALGKDIGGARASFCLLFAGGGALRGADGTPTPPGGFVRAARTARMLRALAEMDHTLIQSGKLLVSEVRLRLCHGADAAIAVHRWWRAGNKAEVHSLAVHCKLFKSYFLPATKVPHPMTAGGLRRRVPPAYTKTRAAPVCASQTFHGKQTNLVGDWRPVQTREPPSGLSGPREELAGGTSLDYIKSSYVVGKALP
ncbi:hypothetical protein EVAR_101779_1 [Eumeta japonica]|uniref:Uncharacterized protein n=1 Tax=Eumeta variegata TaxID=151549 RepID=A0A4C1SMG8_EUMVA|nr:hypothetical protein EVAR_101779_1 [Eumeta japonica]